MTTLDRTERIRRLPPEKRALLLEALRRESVSEEAPRRAAEIPAPASFAQGRLWLLDQITPGNSAYNVPFAVHLAGRLDGEALAHSLDEVVRRHEPLRTTLAAGPDGPLQIVHPAVGQPLPRIDLTALPAAAREAEAERQGRAEARRPFDLARGPLIRTLLLRLGDEEYLLVLNLHHAVTDGWSNAILLGEIGALHAAFTVGLPSPLPELGSQYADFADWQRGKLTGETLDRLLGYWRRQLAGAPAALDLPADRLRPAHRRAPLAGVVSRRLGRDAVARLEALGGRREASLFMVLLAGFQALLGRHAGTEDIVVGSPVAGRGRSETEELIGLFVNMLPLRVDLAGSPSFLELLERARRATLEAHDHAALPFERLVEELRPGRESGGNPFFQVVLSLQSTPSPALDLPGLVLRQVPLHGGIAKFELTLAAEPDGRLGGEGGLVLWLEHDRELFDPTTAARLLDHFLHLLDGAVARPESRLPDLPFFGPAERHQVEVEWAAPAAAVDSATTIPALFRERAAADPGAPALVTAEEELSYGELRGRANRVAHHLQALGVGPEVPVGVALDRSADLVVTLLGVLAAGGAYVPLDPGYPDERLASMLEDGEPPLVVTAGELTNRFARLAAGRRIVALDREATAIAARSDEDPEVPVSPDGLAYILFTSGSTGRPKGVAVPHRAIVRLMREAGFARLAADEVLLQLAPVSFDASTLEIWGALANGARLAIPPAGALSLAEIGEALGRFGVTTLWLTAGLFHQMVDERPAAFGGADGLRQLLAGGDVLSPIHVRRMLETVPGCVLINGYGPTENTTFTCCQPLRQADEVLAPVPIGRPVGGTYVRVLDGAFRPVPIGVPGELCAGGDGLARGYAGQPALTAERFVPDPGAASPGARLYRTGDRVRFLADGRIEFLGRLDHQVKVRGFRIEPEEVEVVLGSHPGVRRAAVAAVPDAHGDRRLAAWVVPVDGDEGLTADLQVFLRERLPAFMVPALWTVLPDLPLTASGKVDRRALPAPVASTGRQGRAPRTPVEEVLAGVWADILGCERVGIDDDFFALGGHSLLATRIASRVQETFGVPLPLAELFDHPTVAGLASRIESRRAEANDGAAPEPPLAPAPLDARDRPLPLSFAQERLWILDRFEPGSPSYNIHGSVRLRGDLDPALLRRALERVVRRQESLRTVFSTFEGEAVQQVLPEMEIPLSLVDLADLEGEARAASVATWDRQVAATAFDLATGPLLRLVLLRLLRTSPAEHVLLLATHHIVSDGWSMTVLIRELTAAYAALREGREPDLPELPVQYADFAVWQRARLTGERLETQVRFWRERLAGAPPGLELPADRPRPAIRTFRGGRLPLAIEPGIAARLRDLGRRQGASLFMTLLAAFCVLLARLAGEEDVVVGTPIAGRGRPEAEELIGMFLNTLVLRTRLAGDPSFAALLGRVRETALAAYAHQDLPFEKLLDELQPARDLSRTPLFQVFFNMLNLPAAPLALPGLTVEALAPPEMPAKFDLTVYAAEEADGAGGLRFDFVYNADLFSAERMAELLRQYAGLLAQAAADPTRPIGALSLVTPAAAPLLPDPRLPLGDEWLGPVHERFVAEARRAPERQAVTDRDESWTYGELEERTARLARHLVAAGIGRGDVVAIYGHRSARLAWAILGVMRAGAAFTVLDPAHPPARIADCLRLAGPRGWIGLAAAGPVPPSVEAEVAAIPCRVTLPAATEPGAESPFPLLGGGGLEQGEGQDGGRLSEGNLDGGHPHLSPPPVPTSPLPGGGSPLRLEARPAIDPPLTPDDLAYIAFTSGSTGVPKGILGRQGPLSHFIPWQRQEFDLRAGDRYSMLSGLAHDPLQRDLFTPLQTGAAVCVPDPAEIAVPGRLAGWMARERITVTHLTPAMGQLLTELPPGAPAPRLTALRWAFFVGDVLTRRDVARLRELAPEVTCVNFYGSTETQRAVGYRRVEEGGGRAKENLPLGRGMKDVQLLVLSRAGELAGIGEMGEIHVRSPHLARGYMGDPAGTAARFVPDGGSDGGRMYRTGDLGRYLPSGDVEFAGRTDFQVKIRGFRIEPGEIEAVLARHPAVRECIVVARNGGGGEKRLVAYLVAQTGRASGEPTDPCSAPSGAPPSPPAQRVQSPAPGLPAPLTPSVGDLRGWLKERLPEAMIPAAFVVLERMPLNPNGKVDRRALAEPAEEVRAESGFVAPADETERTIAAVLQDVLGRERIGIHDNFFELGGNSLLLVRAHARLRELLGSDLQVVDLFSHPTVALLAAHAGRRVAAPSAARQSDLRMDKVEAGQSRLLRLRQRRQQR